MKRNLAVAGAAAAASVSACYSVWLWVSNYAGDNFNNDFTFYYAAARLGLTHGWSHLYVLRLQQEQLDEIGSHITVVQLAQLGSVALVFSRRWRLFASYVVVLAKSRAASLVALGTSGAIDYGDRLN